MTILITAKTIKTIPGPAARTQEFEKIATIAAISERTQLFIAAALADLPGLESTWYTDDGLIAEI